MLTVSRRGGSWCKVGSWKRGHRWHAGWRAAGEVSRGICLNFLPRYWDQMLSSAAGMEGGRLSLGDTRSQLDALRPGDGAGARPRSLVQRSLSQRMRRGAALVFLLLLGSARGGSPGPSAGWPPPSSPLEQLARASKSRRTAAFLCWLFRFNGVDQTRC